MVAGFVGVVLASSLALFVSVDSAASADGTDTTAWADATGSEETDAKTEVVFAGDFRFAGGKRQREGVVDAIERSVQSLLPIFQNLARKRLARANPVPPRVAMAMEGDELVIRFGPLNPMRAPLDGSVRTWRNQEGTRIKLKFERRGPNKIVQTTWGGGGGRVMVWSLDDDGRRLRVHSRMWSPSLPVDVEYRLTFRR